MLKKNNSLLSIIFCGFFLASSAVFAVESEKAPTPPKSQEHKHSDGHHKQCSQKMSMVDLDKDGKVSKEEFTKHHEKMFDKIDTNKDGFLDESEMHHMMDRMHGKCKSKHGHQHHGSDGHKHDDPSKEKSQ